MTNQSVIIFAFAIIFHGFIQGFNFRQYDDKTHAALVIISLLFYKSLISFAFGVVFITAGRQFRDHLTLFFTTIYIAASPGGIIACIILKESNIIFRSSDPALIAI